MAGASGEPVKRRYPVKPMEDGDDPRFTFGLVLEVAEVLAKHGYPSPADPSCAMDFVDLRQMLFRFLYAEDRRGLW
ncbi:hypothetical protein [Gandjariella thermophila]|uniref:Uncharacterized protein n=1 Tax=Gandjariella thermophila TaxID=1931992 RepID=A0A4D4J459_9PSEU|nr:hypothetical protein [Gandjariella thermophila]GDY28767.1 hypothetical protein GTS_04000 [Gandjariella thermophila]